MIGTKPATGAAVRLPPVGFWSYSRQDDELSGGKLSKLRALLVAEIQQQYGRETVWLFQDVSTIPHGAEWEREIRTSIQESTFFVPIVTPNFIQSEWCSTELLMFLEREQELGAKYPDLPRRSRIFPIQFIDISGVDPHDPRVLAALEQRQTFDFRGLRYRNFQDESVQQALGEFATSIRRALQLKVHLASPVEPPVERAAAPPLAAASAPPHVAPIAAVSAAVHPSPPPPPPATSGTPRTSGWFAKPIAWAALALAVGLTAGGAVYFAGGEPEPAVAPAEAPRTASAAPPRAPPTSGGGWEEWKAQVGRWTTEQQARADAAPEASATAQQEAPAATPAAGDDGAACERLYRQARGGGPNQEAASLRRYLGQCARGEDRNAAERRLAEISGYRDAIQRVLAEDRRGGSSSPDAVFQRVRSIDTSGTPPEFRRAYGAHVAAWRDRAAAERGPDGPRRQERIFLIEQRVRSTYERAAAIAARYGAR